MIGKRTNAEATEQNNLTFCENSHEKKSLTFEEFKRLCGNRDRLYDVLTY